MSGEYGDRGIIHCYFKHELAMMCEQVHYHDAIVMNYFATNSGVFFGLLHVDATELPDTLY